MIRYYACPIIGTGKGQIAEDIEFAPDPDFPGRMLPTKSRIVQQADPYRPAIADVGRFNWVASIPSHQDGSPKFQSCVVYVDAPQEAHTQIQAAPGVVDLLDGLLTDEADFNVVMSKLKRTLFSAIPLQARVRMRIRSRELAKLRNDPTVSVPMTELEDQDCQRWLNRIMRSQDPQADVQRMFVRP